MSGVQRILRRITGGRPMRRLWGRRWEPWTDVVSGRRVYYWTAAGRIYMAHSAWSWFRVEVK